MVIHQTIYDLFPPQSFPPSSTLPITPTEFIQLVLVPEAAVSLIMEDLSQTREQAILTLRESAEYGVAMFPYDQDDAGGDVGENIIKERARARRQQLKEEGAWDEAPSFHDTEPATDRKMKTKTRKGKKAAPSDEEESETKVRRSKRASGRVRKTSDLEDARSEAPLVNIENTDTNIKETRRVTRSVSRSSSITIGTDEETMAKMPSRPRPRRAHAPTPESATERDRGNNLSSDADMPMSAVSPTSSLSDVPRERERKLYKTSLGQNDIDATPKPKHASSSRASSVSSIRATVGTERKIEKLKPLDAAREKRAKA